MSTATDKLSTKEQVILLKSSRLNGFIFPPWTSPVDLDDFTLKKGEEQFMYVVYKINFHTLFNILADIERDTPELRLSSALSSVFDGWKRPDELFSSSTWHDVEGTGTDGPHMEARNDSDLIQGATPDCSVVVGLCALSVLPRKVCSDVSMTSGVRPAE